jgi:hypothetical protein
MNWKAVLSQIPIVWCLVGFTLCSIGYVIDAIFYNKQKEHVKGVIWTFVLCTVLGPLTSILLVRTIFGIIYLMKKGKWNGR